MSAARAISIVLISLLSIAIVLPMSNPVSVASSASDPGTIAYVRSASNEIRLIQPDRTNDRSLWTSPETNKVLGVFGLVWRPDGGMLAFNSDHEDACSVYDTDIYAILNNGTGLRRVTNSPACAELANYPQGTVTVHVANYFFEPVSIYVQGATELGGAPGGAWDVTFDHVADLGEGVLQPVVGIYGYNRYLGLSVDVKAGQTVYADITIGPSTEALTFGTQGLSWRSDGSQIDYATRNCGDLYQISSNPPLGSLGQKLPTAANTFPCLVAPGPASKPDQFLYYSRNNPFVDGLEGIYLTSTNQTDGGTQLVSPGSIYQQFGYDAAAVHDLRWLPDGSGFLFTETYVYVNLDDPDAACEGTCSDVFVYNFVTGSIAQITRLDLIDGTLGGDDTARSLSVSPDGQYIALERVTETSDPLNPNFAIWVMGRDGSGLRQLVSDGHSPAWGPSPSSTPVVCGGDCDGSGKVTVDEILMMVNIALDSMPITACDASDTNHDGQITVDEILIAVTNALIGCPK